MQVGFDIYINNNSSFEIALVFVFVVCSPPTSPVGPESILVPDSIALKSSLKATLHVSLFQFPNPNHQLQG